MCTGAAWKCAWGVGVLQGSVTPTDPLQTVPPLPPPAGSDGGALRGELGQGPIHIDPTPHIRGPHCARRPTIRDGLPRLLTLRFTFTSLSDSVVILWCPSQPSTDGMRRGVGGPQGHALPQSRPGGGKDSLLRPPLSCAHDQTLGVFPGGFAPGGYPSPTPRATSRVPGGGVGNGAPAPHGVSQRAPPSSVRDFPPPPFCPVLGGRSAGPRQPLGPQRLWLSPTAVVDRAPVAGHLPMPPGAPTSWPQHRG